MEPEECSCCISPFSSRKKPVECPKCKFRICSPCFERYTLDNLAVDYIGTVCMSCKEPLSFDFIVVNTSKTFTSKKWKDKRKEVLIGIEKAKLPDTQNTASKYREFQTIGQNLTLLIREEIARLREMLEMPELVNEDYDINPSLLSRHICRDIKVKIGQLHESYKLLKAKKKKEKHPEDTQKVSSADFRNIRKQYKTARDLFKTIITLINDHVKNSYNLNMFMDDLNNTDEDVVNENEAIRERRKFIMPCPIGDCKGFMSSGYKCGLCQGKICPKCHIQLHGKDEEHICDKALAESVKAINDETKPCPKCGARISKINGCDQMWCLHCKTAFSWNTGKIVQGERIHNPEYFRWMREHNQEIPRVEHQVDCNRFPDIFELERLGILGICSEDNADLLIKLLRIIIHIEDVEIPALTTTLNRDLRVKYLCNELDDQKMTTILIKRERKNMKNRFLAGIYRLIVDVISDKLRVCAKLQEDIRAMNTMDMPSLLDKTEGVMSSREVVIHSIKEIIQLCRYVNEQMENFTKMHSLKTPRFQENKNNLFEVVKPSQQQKRVYRTQWVTYYEDPFDFADGYDY